MITESFSAWLTIAISTPFVLVAGYQINKHFPSKLPGLLKERRLFAVLTLLGAFGWCAFNLPFMSQNVYVYNDPGIYSVTARWLVDHNDLNMKTSDVFGEDPKITPDTSGFGLVEKDSKKLSVQAPHMFPALLGLAGKITDHRAIFYANAIFGALALLSVFSIARLYIRPLFASLSSLFLGLSLPMIYFTRDTYTEPLTMAMIFTAVSFMAIAIKANSKIMWFLSGLVGASAVIIRVDAYLVIASLLAALFIFTIIEKPHKIKKSIANICSFLGGTLISAAVGWIDLTKLSTFYYRNLNGEINSQLILILAIFIFGSLGVYISARSSLFSVLYTKTKRWLPVAAGIIIISFFVFLASRPLWLESHRQHAQSAYIGFLQEKNGLKVDPTKYYTEDTLDWMVWYLGLPLVILGILGLVIVTRDLLKRNKTEYLPLLAVFVPTALLYFNLHRATPYHVWVSRRFLPIIMPALAIFAVFAIAWIARWKADQKLDMRRVFSVLLIIVVIIASILSTTKPFLRHKEFAGQRAQIESVCSNIKDSGALLIVGHNGNAMTQPIKTYCGVETEKITSDTSQAELAAAASAVRAKGYTPYVMFVDYEYFRLPPGSEYTLVSEYQYKEVERTLERVPNKTEFLQRNLYMGIIKDDGIVRKL